MSEIWQACEGTSQIKKLSVTATRIVESQEQVATMALADSLEEQQILEALLDATKPPQPPNSEAYHYLVMTPFRYPPLPNGSRFGTRARTGIFYASLKLRTVLAECAYYRLVFWNGMEIPPPKQRLVTEHTTFDITVDTAQGITLNKHPFEQYLEVISHPSDYRMTQTLGEAMRDAEVEAFTYLSARDEQQGANIAVFSLSAITSKNPLKDQQWLCATQAERVSFVQLHSRNSGFTFPIEQFLYSGKLPQPAC